MINPSFFQTTSPRFGLPLLYAGQAQKEVYVNEAHALTDALLHCAIEGTATSPPSLPTEGSAWLIGSAATGAWLGNDGAIACRQGGNWLFVAPTDGMRIFDRSSGQHLIFFGSWKIAPAPSEPTGGSVVDSEARAAVVELIAALRVAGIFPAS